MLNVTKAKALVLASTASGYATDEKCLALLGFRFRFEAYCLAPLNDNT